MSCASNLFRSDSITRFAGLAMSWNPTATCVVAEQSVHQAMEVAGDACFNDGSGWDDQRRSTGRR